MARVNSIRDTSGELLQRISRVEKYESGGRVNPAFPPQLLPYGQMPRALYLLGSFPDPSRKSAAIVGARACSAYGRQEARRFAAVLASAGVQIISGMASGIDAWAHRGALEVHGRTFAVLGCGVNICYPRENYNIYREMIGTGGGVLSEFPPDTPPLAWHFPVRNRIISALADLVLVVEAREKSGSLITADYALDQGKTIYAVPGRNDDPLSEGCNRLIAQGAGIATDPDILLEELGILPPDNTEKAEPHKRVPPEWMKSEPWKKTISSLSSREISLNDLQERTGLDTPQLCEILVQLCLSGFAEEVTPGCYRRTW